eukprot:6187277-Pleurochrysis_carterae.AAC.6
MMRRVHEHTLRRREEFLRWAAHGMAEHANSIGHVRSSLRGTVQERVHERLIGRQKVRVYVCTRLAKSEGNALRQKSRNEVGNVLLLGEHDMRVRGSYVDVKQVRNGPLVLDIPMGSERINELRIKKAVALVRVQSKQVVKITTKRELLALALNVPRQREHARVGRTLREPEL